MAPFVCEKQVIDCLEIIGSKNSKEVKFHFAYYARLALNTTLEMSKKRLLPVGAVTFRHQGKEKCLGVQRITESSSFVVRHSLKPAHLPSSVQTTFALARFNG